MRLVALIAGCSVVAPFMAHGIAGQKNSQYGAFSERLSGSERAAQALDRLTFGPRPGDAEEVERIGLRKWVEWQLHPEQIAENAALVSKLKPYASLSMKPRDLFLHYPSPQFIREIAEGRQAPPADPEARAVADELVARYLRKQDNSSSTASMEAGAEGAPLTPLSALLSSTQIETLERGKPDDKRNVLNSISAGRQLEFTLALRPGQRKALLPLAPVPLQRKLLLSLSPQQVILTDLASARILRAVYSERQLQEEMVDFWFNHFNIYFNKGAERYLVTGYEREVIRPHVFGKFYDLLLATAKSPAMLFYLDNAESVAPNALPRFARNAAKPVRRGLNENYGRELMELHTLGVNGGYTQRDIIEVARCFTGWTISPPRRGGEFRFNPRLHDFGPKTVLGHVIHAGGGMSDGLEVLKILANSPATAHHISLELATRFVADNPPPPLVERMTATYLRTRGDIRAVLETMIFSPEFFSKGAYRAKVKTPFEMTVSAVRASGADVESPLGLDRQIAQLGEPLYLKIEPTGYSNNNAEWMNTASLLGRMNFALALSKNHIPGVFLPVTGGEQLAATFGSPAFQRH